MVVSTWLNLAKCARKQEADVLGSIVSLYLVCNSGPKLPYLYVGLFYLIKAEHLNMASHFIFLTLNLSSEQTIQNKNEKNLSSFAIMYYAFEYLTNLVSVSKLLFKKLLWASLRANKKIK